MMRLAPRFTFGVLLTASVLLPALARAQSVTLAWNPSPESDVAGYRLSVGNASRTYTTQIDVGNTTTYEFTGIDLSADYFFAVQAYSFSGFFSDFSSEVRLPATIGRTVISNFAANASYPLLVGRTVTWSTVATSNRGAVEYKFLRLTPSGQWIVEQDYSRAPLFIWTPEWSDLGNHAIQVWARSVGSRAVYEAWAGTNPFSVSGSAIQLSADADFPLASGQPVKWTASIAGATAALEYRFVVLNHATGIWTVVREYAASNQAVWTPSAAGTYTMQAWARRARGTTVFDLWTASGPLTISRAPLEVTGLDVNTAMPTTTGTTLTWTARIRGGDAGPIQYQFVRFSSRAGWEIVRPYSLASSYTWTPSWADEGQYTMQVWVRNAGSVSAYDAWRGSEFFEVRRAPIAITAPAVFPVPPGTPVNWTATIADPSVPFEYQFLLYTASTGTWSVARAYGASPNFRWTPSAVGTYAPQIWARRVGSTEAFEEWRSTGFLEVSVSPATVLSLTPSVSMPGRVGDSVTWTAVASGGAAPLQYKFLLFNETAGWSILRDWSPASSVAWTPASAHVGQNAIQVWVRSAGSAATFEDWRGSGLFVIRP
jgi:hypothetical protein